jgi:flagellar biosynthesis protein
MNMPEEELRRKKAVALKYDHDSNAAPRVIVKGAGHIAEQILSLAEENDIHIHEDPDLLNILVALELQSEIPEHLYVAIAEILAFIYQLNNSLPER